MDRQEQEGIDESLAEIMQESEWGQEYGTGGLEEYNENLLEQIRVDTFSEPTRTDEEDVVANLGDDFYAQFNDVGQGGAVRDFTQGLLCSLQTEENEPGQVQTEENEPEQGLGGTKPIRKVYGHYAGPANANTTDARTNAKNVEEARSVNTVGLGPDAGTAKGVRYVSTGEIRPIAGIAKAAKYALMARTRLLVGIVVAPGSVCTEGKKENAQNANS